MPKVTFEFDYYEDAEQINIHMKAREYYCSLIDIYNEARNILKHHDEPMASEFEIVFERIKELAWTESF